MINKRLLSQIAQQLENAHHILITCHIRPDGDAIGSLIGLGLALQAAGKEIQMICADGVPSSFQFLHGWEQVLTYPQAGADYVIVLDSSDLRRTGNSLDGYLTPDLNIDHHITNEYFARTNLVVPKAVATAQILANFLPEIGITITKDVAAALMTGIVTDTLGFRTSNMTPEALRVAARLMEIGVDLPYIYQRTLLEHTLPAIRYWSSGLGRIQRQNGILWTCLTLADRKIAGYQGRDDADLINLLSSVTDTDIAIIFVEQTPERVKVSWRSRSGIDVSGVAQSFGGGGHPNAAGAEIARPLPEVQEQVLLATNQLINNQEKVG